MNRRRWEVLWCRVTFRHRGRIGSTRHLTGPGQGGPFWMCDRCGEIRR
jgi:hypothetical protein